MKKKNRKEKKERKERELEKMKEWVIKCWMLKKGSKKFEYGPKFCVIPPWVFKVDFCILKGILSV